MQLDLCEPHQGPTNRAVGIRQAGVDGRIISSWCEQSGGSLGDPCIADVCASSSHPVLLLDSDNQWAFGETGASKTFQFLVLGSDS